MTELIRKELRSLVPMIWLGAFLALVPWFVSWATRFTDQGGTANWWTDANQDISSSAEFFQMLFIATVAAAHGLLLREKDEGTLEFLDSLPAGRTRIFLAKAIALQAPVLVFGLADFFATALELWMSRTSLDPRWHAQWLGRGLGLVIVGGWAFAGLGLALGFLRRFAVMALMVWYALFLGMSEAGVPWAAKLNLFAFGRDDFYGLDWLTPWVEIRDILLTGAIGYFLAWLGWLGTGGQARLSSGALQARAVVAVLGTLAAVVSVIAGLGLWMYSNWAELEAASEADQDASHTDAAAAHFPDAPPFRLQTTHFDIIAPAGLRTRAESLASVADATLKQVSDFLQIPPPRGRLVADFTAESPHALGVAGWKKVNITLGNLPDGPGAQAVLGHELTHVFIDLGSHQKASDRFASTRWFHEGLASYLEHRFWRTPEETKIFRRGAAIAHHRRQSAFDILASDSRFTRTYDPNLVYALGEAWCHALVRRHGDTAPGVLVKSLATATPSDPTASAVELWQAVLAAAGFDYAGVLEEYRSVLTQWEADERSFIEALPDLRPRLLTHDPFWLGIEVANDGPWPEGARAVVLFRKQGGTLGLDYQGADREEYGIHWVTRDEFPNRELEVIVGLSFKGGSSPIFGEWVKLRTR